MCLDLKLLLRSEIKNQLNSRSKFDESKSKIIPLKTYFSALIGYSVPYLNKVVFVD